VINYPCDEMSVINCCVVECIVIKCLYFIPPTDKPTNIQTSAKHNPFTETRWTPVSLEERNIYPSVLRCVDLTEITEFNRTHPEWYFDWADRYGGVVKSGRVVCRVVSVEAATSLNHMTLIARLLTRLHDTRTKYCL